jgi:hypothetical protein
MAVKPFADQTLTNAINRAKACELTRSTGMTRLANYATKTTSETSELVKLVSALTTHVTKLEKKLEDRPHYEPRRYNNRNNTTNSTALVNTNQTLDTRPPIICYTCGEPGHISRRCTKKPVTADTITPIAAPTNTVGANNDTQATLQALLRQISNQTTSQQSLN